MRDNKILKVMKAEKLHRHVGALICGAGLVLSVPVLADHHGHMNEDQRMEQSHKGKGHAYGHDKHQGNKHGHMMDDDEMGEPMRDGAPHHGQGKGHMMDNDEMGDHMRDGALHHGQGQGHMMDGDEMGQPMHRGDSHPPAPRMGEQMREVQGHGRLNKIMSGKHMVNINHEAMPQMNWPKMRMNFKTQEHLDLSQLSPGEEVTFTLLVDDDNNYVIKEIRAK